LLFFLLYLVWLEVADVLQEFLNLDLVGSDMFFYKKKKKKIIMIFW